MNLPIGKQPIHSKWVYKVKVGFNGQPIKLKARFLALSFEQQVSINYEENFALVTKWSTIYNMVTLTTNYD